MIYTDVTIDSYSESESDCESGKSYDDDGPM